MDCGCKVEGYCSDITRTIVFERILLRASSKSGTSNKKHRLPVSQQPESELHVKIADAAAAVKLLPVQVSGPGYQLPGLPHRTGHGIGMDGHEWGNMVKGNQQSLLAGMCFSIEPTIIIPGQFGVRLEDCVYMTTEGPKWFSEPAISISKPFSCSLLKIGAAPRPASDFQFYLLTFSMAIVSPVIVPVIVTWSPIYLETFGSLMAYTLSPTTNTGA